MRWAPERKAELEAMNAEQMTRAMQESGIRIFDDTPTATEAPGFAAITRELLQSIAESFHP
jgi:hypothetical protein